MGVCLVSLVPCHPMLKCWKSVHCGDVKTQWWYKVSNINIMNIFIPHPSFLLSPPPLSVTYVPAHQVDQYRERLCLPPLGSIGATSPSSSPTPENPSPESASAKSFDPVGAASATQASPVLKHSAPVKCEVAASGPAVRASAPFKEPLKVPTITPALDSR